jgi:hypothetical protein
MTELAFELRGLPRPIGAVVPPLEATCHICNAKPGESCSSITNAGKQREPHAGRGLHDQRYR